jgi:poly-gamma-glutamate capsule biosynthesis protein CapA/YwtB (metallophosphatase superfamily)
MKKLIVTFLSLSISLVLIFQGGKSYAQKPELRMLFVGDMMLDELPGKVIKQGKDPFAAFKAQFNLADLRFGNLECVIGDDDNKPKSSNSSGDTNSAKREIKPYTFRAHPRVLKNLKKYFSAVSLANNHTGDFGPVGMQLMLTLLEKNQMPYFGGGRDLRAAHAPYVVEAKGRRIAILAYSDIFPRSFEALEDRPGVAWADDEQVKFDIQNARTEHAADIVIVYPHWGWEHEKTASQRQVQLAHLMIDAGADAVVGGHPHVTQNIEVYKEKPIFYSLGNFIFNGFSGEDSTTGWVLELVFSPDDKLRWMIHVAKLDQNGIPAYHSVLPVNILEN